MKKIFAYIVAMTLGVYFTSSVFAQSPQKMSYQAIIRNANEALVQNQEIGMKISILQGSQSGTAVYAETQTPTTNSNGLVSIEIGSGTVQSGDMATINWANGPYFIKTETDIEGGVNYTITGTSQLLSTQEGQMQYWNGSAWVTVAPGNEGDILTFSNNRPTWVGESSVSTVLNPATGRIWMDRNLGASRVATAKDDSLAFGGLYQWGRPTDGHEQRTSVVTTVMSSTDVPGHGDFIAPPAIPFDWRNPQNDDLWQGVNGTNNPCPAGFRIPTSEEWHEERMTWTSMTDEGAFNSPLKLTVAGCRDSSSGAPAGYGWFGNYWASNVDHTGDWSVTERITFDEVSCQIYNTARAYGFSVRCIKE
jgi:uncharacterized protein (TIGR02145 family)